MKIFKEFVGAIKSIDENERTVVATVSTATPDRVGESIPVDAWNLKNYQKNPVILWAHDYGAPPVGKALWTKVEGGGLIQKIKFAATDFAQDIFSLYKDGFLNAFSVGFQAEREKDNPNMFKNAELLEVSCVPVPCNAEALAQRMIKGEVKFKSEKILTIVKAFAKASDEQDEKKVDETETSIRVRVRPPSDFEEGTFRTIDISKDEGISSVVGKLKDGDGSMVIQNYMFDKAKDWTVEKAVKWVEDHKDDKAPEADKDDGKGLPAADKKAGDQKVDPAANDASKGQGKAENADVNELIAQKNALLAELGEYKVGRVLSNKNRELIGNCINAMTGALDALQELYDATDPDASDDGKDEKVPEVKDVDKPGKISIIHNKKTEATGISAKDLPDVIAAALRDSNLSEIVRGEVNRITGKIE